MTSDKTLLHLIGLKPDPGWLPPAVADIINQAEVLAGTDRLLELFPQHPGQKISLTLPLKAWLEQLSEIQAQGRRVAVLTSGDPNFFGLAKTLLKTIDPAGVRVIPSTTVVQEAFARLGVSWDRAEVVSLHGREGLGGFWNSLYRAGHCGGSGYLAIYTDADNTPSVIAKRLLGRGQQHWRMTVFEDLGTPDEQISSWSLYEAKLRRFSPLNLVVLECLKKPEPISLGMPEAAFVHEAGLITKREIRVVALGLLELRPDHILWDLGAGSGSVSIEAAALMPQGSIWAVEKSPLRSEQISANRAYFGATQVEIVEDDSLAAMVHLPAPDRIFIGGGGRDLAEIIKGAAKRIKPEGLIVANVVNLEALNQAIMAMGELNLDWSVTHVQTSRSEPLGSSHYLKPLNPVYLIKGEIR